MSEKLKSNVFNLAYISIFFMYFQLTPLKAETQPLIILLLIPIVILLSAKSSIIITKQNIPLFVFVVILIIYFVISLAINDDAVSVINYAIRLLVIPIAYLMFLKDVKYLSIKTVKYAIYMLLAVTLIELFHIPGLYHAIIWIYDHFFGRYNFSTGTRGICILTVEPSYFTFFAMVLMYSLDYLFLKQKVTSKDSIILKAYILFMCLTTKSGLVYLFVVIYSIQYLYKITRNRMAFIGCSLLICLFALLLFAGLNVGMDPSANRFFEILSKVFSADGIVNALFYSDASSGFRFIINAIYTLSIFVYPLGRGYGGIAFKWQEIADYFNINVWRNAHFSYAIRAEQALDAQAYIPNLIGTIGIFALVFIYFLYKNNKLNDNWLRKSLMITLTLFLWFLQSNFFNPVFWILIAFAKDDSIESIAI